MLYFNGDLHLRRSQAYDQIRFVAERNFRLAMRVIALFGAKIQLLREPFLNFVFVRSPFEQSTRRSIAMIEMELDVTQHRCDDVK